MRLKQLVTQLTGDVERVSGEQKGRINATQDAQMTGVCLIPRLTSSTTFATEFLFKVQGHPGVQVSKKRPCI